MARGVGWRGGPASGGASRWACFSLGRSFSVSFPCSVKAERMWGLPLTVSFTTLNSFAASHVGRACPVRLLSPGDLCEKLRRRGHTVGPGSAFSLPAPGRSTILFPRATVPQSSRVILDSNSQLLPTCQSGHFNRDACLPGARSGAAGPTPSSPQAAQGLGHRRDSPVSRDAMLRPKTHIPLRHQAPWAGTARVCPPAS